eukprot:347119_1
MSKGSIRTLCIPPTPFCTFLLILSLLQITILFPLISHGFIQSIKNKKTLPQLYKIIYWITSFFLLIAGITFPIHQMFNFTYSAYCDNFDRIEITVSITLISYMISLVCISGLYLVRIILTFKHSLIYSISKTISSSLIFGIFIQSILVTLTIYYDIKVWWSFKNDPENVATIYTTLGYIYLAFGIANIMYNVILLYLFLRNIHKLSHTVTKKNDMHSLIQTSLVYSLCLFLTISSTLVASFLGWIRSNLVVDTNELYMLHLTLIAYDILFNVLSINLQFEYYKKSLFNKCICCKLSFNYLIKKLIKDIDDVINDDKDHEDYTESVQLKKSKNITESETTTNATTESSFPQLTVNTVPKLNKSITMMSRSESYVL